MEPMGFGSELDQLHAFLHDRFRSEAEASSFLGGPSGAASLLDADDFSRVLRMAGYRGPPERLFHQLGDGTRVQVAAIFQGAGLLRDPPRMPGSSSLRGRALPEQDSGTVTLAPQTSPSFDSPSTLLRGRGTEADLRQDVADLRREVSQLKLRTRDVVPAEALYEERAGQEGNLRQVSARLEEALARETTALRTDHADLRASLTEALRLLAEERKERQAEVADTARRMKDLQQFSEERTRTLETNLRGTEQRLAETKLAQQEGDKSRELSEFKVLSGLSKDARSHETAVQREQQTRESMVSELEGRWRGLLNEERQLRSKETDGLSVQLARLDDSQRSQRESHVAQLGDAMVHIEDLTRELHEEARGRQSEAQSLLARVEELRAMLQQEGRDRRDGADMLLKRVMVAENALERQMDRAGGSDKELMALQQSVVDLNAAANAEATARQESVSRLQQAIDHEGRLKDQGFNALSTRCDEVESRLDGQLRSVVQDERARREDSQGQLEARINALTQEHNFEKNQNAEQRREVTVVLQGTKDELKMESGARKQDINFAVKALDELREEVSSLTLTRERDTARISEQLTGLDEGLREEGLSRENDSRRAASERVEIQDAVVRVTRGHEEFKASTIRRNEEERRLREENETEARARDENASKIMIKLQTMIREEQDLREQGQQALAHKAQTAEQAILAERGEREDGERTIFGRLGGQGEEMSDMRAKLRECQQRCEEVPLMREAALQDRGERQADYATLELGLKDAMGRVDQVAQARDGTDKRLDTRVAELLERLDLEARDRAAGDQDSQKRLADEHADRVAAQAGERRHIDEAMLKSSNSLRGLLSEERINRELTDAALESRLAELRDAVDSARKWRVEQYNELVFELSKVTEVVSQEGAHREQQDQILAGEIGRLREEALEEAHARKAADAGVQEEVHEVGLRGDREVEERMAQDRERWRAIEELRDLATTESSRREAVDNDLKQHINKEVLAREEAIQSTARAAQRANAQTNEDWRNAIRAEAQLREEAHARVEQEIRETQNAVQETRAVVDQNEEEGRRRFREVAEALASEESGRKAEDDSLKRICQKQQDDMVAEELERNAGDRQSAEHFVTFEAMLKDEVTARQECERRLAKDILAAASKVHEEQVAREEADHKLDSRINGEIVLREEGDLRETKLREEGDNALMEALRRAVAEEQVQREDDKKDLVSKIHLVQREGQQEHEERLKGDRELLTAVTRLQSAQREEEDSRSELGDRLGAAVLRMSEEVRATAPAREDILKKAMDYTEQMRALLVKETEALTAKLEAASEAVRDVRLRVGDEAQTREGAVRTLADALVEERSQREDGLIRERQKAEDELQRTVQGTRQAREEQERRIQERLLEIAGTVSEEREVRQEGLRSERQRIIELKEDMQREQKVTERELSKLAMQQTVTAEDAHRRSKDSDAAIAVVADKCDTTRAALESESLRRETDMRNLDQRAVEIHSQLAMESKERREMNSNLRKNIEEEANLREAAMAADRRARLESRPPALTAGTARPMSLTYPGGASMGASIDVTSNIQIEQRSMKQTLNDIVDRVAQAELRQKSAEERTVHMLDAIMSGLTGSGE